MLADFISRNFVVGEQPGQRRVLKFNQAKEQVLGADVFMTVLIRDQDSLFDRPLGGQG